MTFLTTEHPRANTGRFVERTRSAPEATLAVRGGLAEAVRRNGDIFHSGAAHLGRHSRSVTVAAAGRAHARMALVWHEDQDRFVVDAWWDIPRKPSRYVHVTELPFDDEHVAHLAESIETEAGATPEVVDELAGYIRSRA